MVTTISFLDDIGTAFKRVYRILKEKGAFIIGFVDRNSPLGKLYQKRKAQSLFYRVATFYSTDEIVFYLRHAGFKDFNFSQTFFRSLTEIKTVESIREGYEEGFFVVIKAIK